MGWDKRKNCLFSYQEAHRVLICSLELFVSNKSRPFTQELLSQKMKKQLELMLLLSIKSVQFENAGSLAENIFSTNGEQ